MFYWKIVWESIAQAIKLSSTIHSIYNQNDYSFEKGEGEKWYTPYVKYALANGIIDNEYKLDICYDIKIKSFYYSKNLIKDSNLLGTIIIYSEDRISDEEKELINTVSTLFNS